jgi:hypothetical protein
MAIGPLLRPLPPENGAAASGGRDARRRKTAPAHRNEMKADLPKRHLRL